MNSKRILVNVDQRGEVELELRGYLGLGCIQEEQRLRQALAAFGVRVSVDALREKSEAEQAREQVCNPQSSQDMKTNSNTRV